MRFNPQRYSQRGLMYTLVGGENKAQQDAEVAEHLGMDRAFMKN
jgi:hypothetical protein